ncbi:hypothetical protein SDC9_66747 [bioreactor metagenome]|uniref:DNA adenine methylase n=1 Tax=bioreactor metagenome TaxID=1076179 RepID=A0A644XX01_9ZZZZ
MKSKVLSAFPYYGGKNRMASLISDMLDYQNASIYIEPFGGACRVLLNKPRHEVEFYNDSSIGLCAFFHLMSKRDTAEELIRRLYDTDYSQECFDEALKYRNRVDDNLVKQTGNELLQYMKQLLVKYRFVSKYANHADFLKTLKEQNTSLMDKLTVKEKSDLRRLYDNNVLSKGAMFETGYLDLLEDWEGLDVAELMTDTQLAISTFVVYSQSRDAMGTTWTASKYKTQEAYHKRVDNLIEVADRMNGVKVLGPEGALSFLLNTSCGDSPETLPYIDNPDVIMYLDPSYLTPEDEEKAKGKHGNQVKPKNLGSAYKQSFDYDDHELFLKTICHAKCKLLVSNYDADLYNKYLKYPFWKRMEFETTTSVGGKRDNKRIEVLWYNY